jgi:hypothetical protein
MSPKNLIGRLAIVASLTLIIMPMKLPELVYLLVMHKVVEIHSVIDMTEVMKMAKTSQ